MSTFDRIMAYCKPYWWRIALAALASAGVGAMDGAFAFLVEPLLKKIFAEKNTMVFTFLPIGIIGLFLFRGTSRFLNDYFISTAGQLAVRDVRNEVYRKTMMLDIAFFHKKTTGGLMSRVLGDVGMMQSGVADVVSGLFRDGISAISLIGVIFYRNWKLGLISVVVIPLTAYPAQKIGKKIKVLAKQGQEKNERLVRLIQETYVGIKVIKAFGLERREIAKFDDLSMEMYKLARRGVRYNAFSTPTMEFITSLGIATVVWVGGASVMNASMSAAEFFSFITAMVLMYSPIRKLLNTYNIMQRSIGASERVFEIIDAIPEISDPPNPVKLDRAAGTVEYRDVSFKYNEDYVLKNVSVSARKGEVIALVGPSGGGKTTFVSLVPRFYDVTEGQILIDGHDIRTLSLSDLLRQIALVDQETILFNDTVANNIRYGKTDATDADVEAAAKAAYAHDFVTELPDGYLHNIGDRGVRLSGGQRQRLCIARAILKDAPILILDEATSALDTESEKMVQMALENLMQNRTTFVIAHRLSTIFRADKIVVIEDGKICETGKHEELLSKGGVYKKLYDLQYKE